MKLHPNSPQKGYSVIGDGRSVGNSWLAAIVRCAMHEGPPSGLSIGAIQTRTVAADLFVAPGPLQNLDLVSVGVLQEEKRGERAPLVFQQLSISRRIAKR